jgi:hypothetical protein
MTVTRGKAGAAGLAVSLAAAAGLLLLSPRGDDEPEPPARAALTSVWPDAQRADIPGNLPDGPVYHPGLFLDARTSVGTAPAPDGTSMRLLVRAADGALRELRRLPLSGNPTFDNFTAAGGEVVWTESADGGTPQVWAANLTTAAEPRMLTADTGNAVFYGSQYDLVIAEDRVHWVAAGEDAEQVTEIRSVPLAGGEVTIAEEPGTWSLSAWPWLADGAGDQTGTTRLRNPVTKRDVEVRTTGAELTTCGPAWCRVMVMTSQDLARIDVMHPDGTARQRIAGGNARAALPDVAILDRFEVLSEPQPDSDLTGTEALLVYDIRTGRTVDVNVAVDGAFSRGGVLWWSTGDQDTIVWHTLDLRTV